jgi:hypothetical protein
MSIVSNEDYEEMTQENRDSYCEWCWYKDYGDCDKCAIGIKDMKVKEETC